MIEGHMKVINVFSFGQFGQA